MMKQIEIYRCERLEAPAPKRRRLRSTSLSRQADRSLCLRLHDGWRIPSSSQRLLLRAVEAHGHIEPTLRRRQAVRFLALAGVLVQEIEIQRTVGVELEGHPGADRLPVEIVGIGESLRIVHGDGPESVHRRRGGFLEVDAIPIRSVE